MVGAQQARFGRPAHCLGDRSDLVAELGARLVFIDPDAERIEHSRDARRGDLRVVSEHGAADVPLHRRPRHVMGFEIVGVQFNEAGQEIVALKIDSRAG